MTLGDAILFAIVGVIAGNHVVVRLPGWHRRLWLFWLMQGLNLGIIVFLLVEGIPSLEGPLVVFNYIFALLMMLRIVQNNTRLTAARAAAEDEDQAEATSKAEALRQALERGRAGDEDA